MAPADDLPSDPLTSSPLEAGRLSDQLCFALYSATNAVTRVYRPLLQELGLTYPQYLVLLVLWERDGRRLGEIAEALALATHAVSPIIDRMEEADLVRRVKDPDDGRAVLVELTATGAALESGAAAVQDEVRCRTVLDVAEVERLRDQLVDLAARMRDE